jgi:hypothetical protein
MKVDQISGQNRLTNAPMATANKYPVV